MKITAERARAEALAVLDAEIAKLDTGIGPESLYLAALNNILTRRVNELFLVRGGDFDWALSQLDRDAWFEQGGTRKLLLMAIVARLKSAVWQLEVASAD
jgi:hypothetical protein